MQLSVGLALLTASTGLSRWQGQQFDPPNHRQFPESRALAGWFVWPYLLLILLRSSLVDQDSSTMKREDIDSRTFTKSARAKIIAALHQLPMFSASIRLWHGGPVVSGVA